MFSSPHSESSKPICFLHVPKCAGSSMCTAIVNAFPAETVARRIDLRCLEAYSDRIDYAQLDDGFRAAIVGPSEASALAGYRAVCGHFMLRTLLAVAPPSAIATVLREPRARLLSLYLFLRLDADMRKLLSSQAASSLAAAMQPLEDFLDDPRLATVTDNHICRVLLDGDPRIPDRGFIDPANFPSIAFDAIEQLDRLGFVGILESGDEAWAGLSRVFGVRLSPIRENVTGSRPLNMEGMPVPPPDSDRAKAVIERSTAADRVVYEAMLSRHSGDLRESLRLAERAYAVQLDRFGDPSLAFSA